MNKKILRIGIFVLFVMLVLPSASSATSDWWPMFHHDPQHSGFSNSTAPDTKHILWTFKAKNEFGFYASAAVINGKVYTATIGENGDLLPKIQKILKNNPGGKVYCLDANTGSIIWQYKSRFGAYATPAVADRKVCVCSGCWYFQNESVTYLTTGDVYCLNATNGNLIWEYRDVGYTEGGPVISDGFLYFGSLTYTPSDLGWVWCFNVSSGQLVWKIPLREPRGPVAVVNGKVYVSDYSGLNKFLCLNASTGDLIWRWNPGYIMDGTSVANGKVYVATEAAEGNPGDLYCLDANSGDLLWQANLINTSFDWSTPAIAYGNVYIGSGMGQIVNPTNNKTRGTFYCVNASTGHLVWKRTGLFPEYKFFTMSSGCLSPAVADGKVYFGCDAFFGPSFFCLDAFTGKTLWTYNRCHPFFAHNFCSSTAIADGKVYVGTLGHSGKLICFG